MPLAARIVAATFAALTGAAASQAPEFSQQYRQRLGGALDELARVIARFDADAAAEGLARDAALERYATSPDAFLTRRGTSVSADIERLDRLRAHAAELEATPPSVRPLLIAREGDAPLLRATLSIYEPAVPLTPSGATYGLSGVFAAMLLWWGGAGTVRRIRRPARRDDDDLSEPDELPSDGGTAPPALQSPDRHATGPVMNRRTDRRDRRVAMVRRSRQGPADRGAIGEGMEEGTS